MPPTVDYTAHTSYTNRDYVNMSQEKVEEIMARKQQNDDLLIEDELAAAFLTEDEDQDVSSQPALSNDDNWEEGEGDFPGQLAVDVYESDEELIIKARTAGVDRNDLDVSISDGILTISGTLSSGDETNVRNWHVQECYWGEFSRTLALPVAVREEGVKAELKDGVLTITFEKVKQEKATKIPVL